ncbi:MAG TPA: IS66 family transposase [Steroidobacteraceae bacterium]
MPSLAAQVEHAPDEIARLSVRVALLEEENRWLKQQLFGRSSEKRSAEDIAPDQARLIFNEAEALTPAADTAAETLTIPAHERKKRGRKPIPAELPRIEVIHDLPDGEKTCPHDGTTLMRIGEETAEQLDYVPAKLRVIRHVRLKYACPGCRQGVKVAVVPAQLLPKSKASPGLLAHITTAKYVDGLPLHRQERQFARLGIELPRATMARWMIELGRTRVVPLVNLLNDHLLDAALVHMDETTVQVLKSAKAPSTDHWMWVRAAGPPGRRMVLFDYDPSRGGQVPKRLLAGFEGILLTDGYEPYDAVVQAQSLVHAGCLAHVRRRFEDARKVQTAVGADSHARSALDYLGELYRIERTIKTAEAEERLAVRTARSAPIMASFHAWLEALAAQVLPQSALGKAVHYTLRQWPKLCVFLTYPAVPLDNNRCENAIRPFVVGRKAWLFSDTTAGATASANLYSLVETARANGIEPHGYLTHLFTHLPAAGAVEDFEALLPWNVRAELDTPR